jgi:hypothetical protein
VIAKAITPPAPPPKPAAVRIAPVIVKPVKIPVKPKVLKRPVALPKIPKIRIPVRAPLPRIIDMKSMRAVRIVAPKLAVDTARAITVHAVAVAPLAPSVVVNPGSAPVVVYAPTPRVRSNDVLDALDAAGIHNLSVDQLIAIRDHGVSSSLIRAAVAYFGTRISPTDLVSLADHGVSATYLESLRAQGVTGIAPASVIMLMDRGVRGSLIAAANAYFHPAPSVADLTSLSDHGVGVQYLMSLRNAGVQNVSVADVIRLMDHGVDGAYIVKIRRWNPRVSIDDIIRLHDSGF